MLDYRATENEIILYWDKPEWAGKDAEYLVTCEGRTQTVHRTHCMLSGLAPDTAYEVSVEKIGRLLCRTGKEKERLQVTDFGAIGDGLTLNTAALQRAIEACGPDQILVFPKGTYRTGALTLHSNMDLLLEEGAVLQGSEDPEDYLPKIPSRFEGHERLCYQSVLNLGIMDHTAGFSCENVVIRGKGTIYGGGKALREATEKAETECIREELAALGDKIQAFEKPETLANRARGRLINMSNCRNIWIHGLTLGYAASWNVHFIYSDQIVTDACTFRSDGIWNGDGWDPDSSTNSTIFGCTFYTEDDSVAIKSGKNPEGNIIARPTQNIRVFDCVTHFGHGLCIGSEMSGGVENVSIWDCEMGPTWSGIEMKGTKKRGGYVRNVTVRDCTASHIMLHSVAYNDDGEGAPEPPIFENCRFEGLHLLGHFLDNNAGRNEWHECPAIELSGYDRPGHELKNIVFKNIEIERNEDWITMERVRDVRFENITVVSKTP